VLLAVTLALAAVESGRPRAQLAPGGTGRVPGRVSLGFPPASPAPGALTLATDSESYRGARAVLWAFTREGRRLTVERWRSQGARFAADQRHVVDGSAVPGEIDDVARWKGRTAVFLIRRAGDRLAVNVRNAFGRPLVMASGVTSPVPRAPGEDRDVAIATWDGSLPDLLVVDRSRRSPLITIRIFSGESSFRTEVLTTRTAIGAFPARAWKLDVGPVNSAKADLALFSRGRPTGSGRTEVHVIQGPIFQAFGEQKGLAMPARDARGRQFRIVHATGLPVALAIDVRTRRIDALFL
jgi:hypothetical protein